MVQCPVPLVAEADGVERHVVEARARQRDGRRHVLLAIAVLLELGPVCRTQRESNFEHLLFREGDIAGQGSAKSAARGAWRARAAWRAGIGGGATARLAGLPPSLTLAPTSARDVLGGLIVAARFAASHRPHEAHRDQTGTHPSNRTLGPCECPAAESTAGSRKRRLNDKRHTSEKKANRRTGD